MLDTMTAEEPGSLKATNVPANKLPTEVGSDATLTVEMHSKKVAVVPMPGGFDFPGLIVAPDLVSDQILSRARPDRLLLRSRRYRRSNRPVSYSTVRRPAACWQLVRNPRIPTLVARSVPVVLRFWSLFTPVLAGRWSGLSPWVRNRARTRTDRLGCTETRDR